MTAAWNRHIVVSGLQSQWLEGSIRHRRKAPINHEFSYHTGMLALDLREWDSITGISPLFSLERFNWLSLHREDYLEPANGTLLEAVSNQVEKATGWSPDGAVQLITHPRYFGYVFNPVSFYFCYDLGDIPDQGAVPRVILAQITNTPWKETHTYCLETRRQPDDSKDTGWRSERFEFSKRFHVSPFNPMNQHYRWTFSFRGPELRVHMNVLQDDEKQFDATLVVHRTPLDRKTLHKSLRQFPLEAFKVTAGIYWHALKLKVKGAQFFTHPDKLPEDSPDFRRGTEDSGQTVSPLDADAKPTETTGTTGKVSSWRI
ncbi:DUF1365 domain-containing protein [Marinobacter confluentis]|uniref:DUF1365 domain-containing protein n=1 Tax=Marinobacter confluentis TaxID=1697557 RepID=A0A4Z1C359_9GAMM|nr:DUF1365 domain-containing protein [Marinobacter confluentis]TGN41638.1 DUF1365 domain-containing protein [Marinobacter confluentis]